MTIETAMWFLKNRRRYPDNGAQLACPRKKTLLIDKTDHLTTAETHGALIPSQRRPAGYNLVLWQWDNGTVKPFDPNNDLPMLV